jgi:hypothetical protein
MLRFGIVGPLPPLTDQQQPPANASAPKNPNAPASATGLTMPPDSQLPQQDPFKINPQSGPPAQGGMPSMLAFGHKDKVEFSGSNKHSKPNFGEDEKREKDRE